MQVGESNAKTQTYPSPSHTQSPPTVTPTASSDTDTPKTGDRSYRLEELAFLRSGDKGNSCNIGEPVCAGQVCTGHSRHIGGVMTTWWHIGVEIRCDDVAYRGRDEV